MELDNLDQKQRKLVPMHPAPNSKGDIDQRYLPRAKRSRGLLQMKQTVEKNKHGLNDYIKKSE